MTNHQIPDSIGRYQILHKEGQGDMGIVYNAYDPKINRNVAIKVLKDVNADDDNYREKFLREAKAAGNLSHPGIVTVFDTGEVNGLPYIAMEYLQGVTLEDYLSTEISLSFVDIVSIAIQLTRALHYAHKQGVIHRDIKPANIIYQAESNTIKITDFGIARIAGDQSLSHNIDEGLIMGTPRYMPPEQFQGNTVDKRSDLYSLGALLFHLTMGKPPFEGENLGDLFKVITENEAPVVKIKGEEKGERFAGIVAKLLSKSSLERYQSGEELLIELLALEKALYQDKTEHKSKFVSLHVRWTFMMVGVVAVTMITGLIVVYLLQYNELKKLIWEYGAFVSNTVQKELAEDLLMEDAVGLQAMAEDMAEKNNLVSLDIINTNNFVLGCSDKKHVSNKKDENVKFILSDELEFKETLQGDIKVYTRSLIGGKKVFAFDSAITFKSKNTTNEIGRVHLVIAQESLINASKGTLYMMIVLMIVTLMAVIIATQVLARKLTRPIDKLIKACQRISFGYYNNNLKAERNDEFGSLYKAFNHMNRVLDEKYGKSQTGDWYEQHQEFNSDIAEHKATDKTLVIDNSSD